MNIIRQQIIVFFIILMFFFVSCDFKADPFEGGDYGDTVLRGLIVDKADSTPLDSVLFTIEYSKLMGNTSYLELNPKTDSTGTFQFEVYCMEHYSYHLNFHKEGYTPNYQTTYPLMIEEGNDNYFFIEMIKDSTKTK
ncbi:MAG TPA: hypothetical protein PLK90_09675 [Clostridiales bacterium]|nr:hypothetical protein [Clostridiales bacterium]HQP70654.1 hypothetical protein [Clostridiales bacterium]